MKEIADMKKKLMTCLAGALMMALCMGMTAYALSPVPATDLEPPLPSAGLDVQASASVAGKAGSWYGPGDLLVLTAAVANNTDFAVSGDLWLTYPDTGCELVACAVLPKGGNGCWGVEDLMPGERAEAVVVLRAPEESKITDWSATAAFAIENGGGCAGTAADLHFGRPELKADHKRLVKDGILEVRNDGNGGASKVKFRFLSKPEWQKDDGLGDGMSYIGEGKIEIDLGGIAAGGKIEKDISGLLHQRMDKKHVFEIVYEDWDAESMPAENWENAD